MDEFKSYLADFELDCIVVYADNDATQFFEKNGFQKLKKNQKAKFIDHIEQYHSASFMGFKLNKDGEDPFMADGSPHQKE